MRHTVICDIISSGAEDSNVLVYFEDMFHYAMFEEICYEILQNFQNLNHILHLYSLKDIIWQTHYKLLYMVNCLRLN